MDVCLKDAGPPAEGWPSCSQGYTSQASPGKKSQSFLCATLSFAVIHFLIVIDRRFIHLPLPLSCHGASLQCVVLVCE